MEDGRDMVGTQRERERERGGIKRGEGCRERDRERRGHGWRETERM